MEPKQRKKYIVGIYVRLSRDDECARGGRKSNSKFVTKHGIKPCFLMKDKAGLIDAPAL